MEFYWKKEVMITSYNYYCNKSVTEIQIVNCHELFPLCKYPCICVWGVCVYVREGEREISYPFVMQHKIY